jgi:hypothetical protein
MRPLAIAIVMGQEIAADRGEIAWASREVSTRATKDWSILMRLTGKRWM